MTPITIIRKTQEEGLRLTLSPSGTIKVTGDATVVNRWLALIREHKEEIIEVLSIGASCTETSSRWWLIHYPDRDPVKVACYPETTHAEMRKRYSNAVAAEPFTPIIRQPPAPLIVSEETAIRAWLVQIEETDPATIAEVIDRCQTDADAREFYLELISDSGRGLFRQRGNDDNI